MARIGGVNISKSPARGDRVDGDLRHRARARARDLRRGGRRPHGKIKDLSDTEMDKLREQVAKFTVEGDLRREVSMNIKRLMDLGTWRGKRHRAGPAGARPAHAHQRAHAQGPAQGGGQDHQAGRHRLKRKELIWQKQAPGCARRSRRTWPKASPTFTRPSTTPSSPSPTARATRSPGRPAARNGFKGSRKSTPFAAQVAAEPRRAGSPQECGVKNLEVRIKGPGPGPRIRGARAERRGFQDHQISDVTPVPHNGCRPPKKRRI